MISGRIQPAMEETAQEILQAVENIEVKVEGTSGVVVGTDGKKYKAVMEDTFTPSLIESRNAAIVNTICYDDEYAYGFRGVNALEVYNSKTLEPISTINLSFGVGVSGSLGIPYHNSPLGIAFNEDYIFIAYKQSTGATYSSILTTIRKSDFKQINWITLPYNSTYDTQLQCHGEYLYLVQSTSNIVIRAKIQTIVNYVNAGNLTGHETITLTNITHGGFQYPLNILGFRVIDNFMLVYSKNGSNAYNFIAKYNLFSPTEFSFVAMVSSVNSIHSFLPNPFKNEILTFIRNGSVIEINPYTLEYEIYVSDVGSDCHFIDENGIWAVSIIGKFSGITLSIKNVTDPTTLRVYSIIDPLEFVKSSATANTSRIYTNDEGDLFLGFTSSPFLFYLLEKSKYVIGYKEVIE